MTLIEWLVHQYQNKQTFSLVTLRKAYPKDKSTIEQYVFIGLIEPADTTGLFKSNITEVR